MILAAIIGGIANKIRGKKPAAEPTRDTEWEEQHREMSVEERIRMYGAEGFIEPGKDLNETHHHPR
jgi:hypothetical protein